MQLYATTTDSLTGKTKTNKTEVMITVIAENTKPPEFVTPLRDVYVTAGVPFTYRFPNVFDVDGDLWTTTVIMGTAFPLAVFMRNRVNINPTSAHIGEHVVSIIMKDDNPMYLSEIYQFKIIVTDLPTNPGGYLSPFQGVTIPS